MHALSIQLSALCIGLLLVGLGAGWWAAHFFQRQSRSACYQELVRLRYAHQRLQQDLTELSKQAANCEAEKTQAINQLADSQDLQQFEQLRIQLMRTRNQLKTSSALLTKREQQLHRLSDLAKLLRKQARPSSVHVANQASLGSTNLPTATHELNCLQEIDAVSAQKLQMLGILNCEQLATCSVEQLRMIQRLLSEDSIVPLAKWVKAARVLAQQTQATNSLAN
ncbi:MAG: hypothetical protein ACH34X_12520 [Thiolinea sp.]